MKPLMKNSFKEPYAHRKQTKSNTSQKLQYKLRQQIAVEAARLMSEEGIDKIQAAVKKAAHKLGIHDEYLLPDSNEVLLQLKIHQSLYQSHSHAPLLRKLRATALNAMQLLAAFRPKLIGSVLSGYAHEHSGIDILVLADCPEDIALFLMRHDIPYQLKDSPLYFKKPDSKPNSRDSTQSVPTYQFYAENYQINLIVLCDKQRKMLPLEPANWQPMPCASLAQLEDLLNG